MQVNWSIKNKMTIRDIKGTVKDKIPVRNVLLSVFDKSGLETFVPGLIETCPDVMFMSTGGTYKKLTEMFAASGQTERLMEVAQYTGFPEMEGGLVKTLHPKIHAGILGERNNPAHQDYLQNTLNGGVYIDMVVVNLYPFNKVIADPAVTFEKARGNIDIGGPTMIRAAAKNFPSCAVICDPIDYSAVLGELRANEGRTSFDTRFALAQKVFSTMGKYDSSISDFWSKQVAVDARKCYKFEDDVGGKKE